jgi:acyl carrier protein
MAFDKQDTQNKIIAIVADQLKIDKNRLKNDGSFQDLGADSLDMVQIVMRLEEQFGIEINDEDAEKMTTLDQVVNYINERRTK